MRKKFGNEKPQKRLSNGEFNQTNQIWMIQLFDGSILSFYCGNQIVKLIEIRIEVFRNPNEIAWKLNYIILQKCFRMKSKNLEFVKVLIKSVNCCNWNCNIFFGARKISNIFSKCQKSWGSNPRPSKLDNFSSPTIINLTIMQNAARIYNMQSKCTFIHVLKY